MIPKIIHYCWLGPHKKSELALRCIESWKTHAPDFEIKEWNEVTSKVFQNKFYKDAYRKRQYAFVADCVRVQALQQYGGIYMDLDMLLLKPLTTVLHYDFFSGYEVPGRTAYGLFGGIPQHRFFKEMSDFYDQTVFNQFSLPVITHTFSGIICDENLKKNEVIFEPSVLYALPYQKKEEAYENYISEKSIAVHLWDHSWDAQAKGTTTRQLLQHCKVVLIDTVFYGYPSWYFKRYMKEFLRKLYHKLVNKK